MHKELIRMKENGGFMFVGTNIDGVLLETLKTRQKMGFTKSAIIREALRQYLSPKEVSA